jgi:small subunit ribosomal protein S10e
MVLIDRKNRRKVYEYLLNEGVIVVKKDWTQKEHGAVTGVPNLHVWMLLRSMADRALVELIFNWHYYYYTINQKGVEYLRKELGIDQ